MRILGISDHFISGAAVVADGRVVSAVNEERLARMKMVMGFPRQSIEAALAIAGVRPDELDAVAVASEWGHFLNEYVPFDRGVFGVDEGMVRTLFFSVGSRLSGLRSKLPIAERLYYDLRRPAFARRRRRVRDVLKDEFGIAVPVQFVSHHLAHAAGAYRASGFDDALLVTLDGAGDGHSAHVYEVRDGRFALLHTVPSFDSLGDWYGYVTHLCGFTAGKHEGKITGLAAHGKPAYREQLAAMIAYRDGTLVNTANAFRHAAIRRLQAVLPADFSKADLSATIQGLAEDLTTRFIGYWQERTGLSNVAVAGGVFANVKINQRVHELPGVRSLFVYPAMSDEGIAAGAALVRWADATGATPPVDRCFDHVYLGPGFSDDDVTNALRAAGIPFTRPDDNEATVARLIADGRVVARFAGRMEYGPRALGNRSILYRPDEPEVNDWLNKRLRRTEFMPFAPVAIAEDADLYFRGLDGARDTARYMTITFDCTDRMRRDCPGVVHVDGTARPQLVRAEDNPSYYRILVEFKRLTGLSCFVNTSFNIHEEPIVCTPDDAIRAFQSGHLDVLAIGPFIAEHPAPLPRPRPAVRIAAERT